MQAPGAPKEDRREGFSLGGWSVSDWDDVMGQAMTDPSGPYELLVGRGTHERFAAHGRTSRTTRWPASSTAPASAPRLNPPHRGSGVKWTRRP
jgi:hypothetical protein